MEFEKIDGKIYDTIRIEKNIEFLNEELGMATQQVEISQNELNRIKAQIVAYNTANK